MRGKVYLVVHKPCKGVVSVPTFDAFSHRPKTFSVVYPILHPTNPLSPSSCPISIVSFQI